MLLRWIGGKFARTTTIVLASVVAIAATIAMGPDNAEARKRYPLHFHAGKKRLKAQYVRHGGRRYVARPAAGDRSGNPRFSAIVVDVKAGKVLYDASPDGLRHPASVTKVMTLYLLFEQLQAGHIKLDSELPVSAHAAAQAPTKLGLRPGSTLRVDDAIKGIVTRSANDAAVVVAEAIGGSESNFAVLMTRKARSLGMNRTSYQNASGLPDPGQITTARDLATLGMAIQTRFPNYYRFFSTRSFVYRGQGIANHNRLLGSVEGVDGIKTGYTRSSGFNLLTSVKRDGRQLVAVVMGGRSGGSRDATMRALINQYLPVAYAGNDAPRQTFAAAEAPALPRAALAMTEDAAPAPAKRSVIRPAVVAETPKPKANAPVAPVVRLAALPQPVALPKRRPAEIARPAIAATAQATPVLRWNTGPAPVTTAPATPPSRTAQAALTSPDTTATVPVRTATYKIEEDGETVTATLPPQKLAQADTNEVAARTGWVIQIGAAESLDAARDLLGRAQSSGPATLTRAEPFTETVQKNGTTLWRARFAGFEDQRKAQAACSALKSRDFECMAVRL